MSQNDIVYLTRDGYRENESKLNYLKNVRRAEIKDRLHRALEEGGELVENAEYADAKHEQALIEGEIDRLSDLLRRARIIEDEELDGPDGVVNLNTMVTVQENGEDPETFHIVGAAEANPKAGKLSHVSPLGKALMGKAVGEEVEIEAPDGSFTFVILSVEAA